MEPEMLRNSFLYPVPQSTSSRSWSPVSTSSTGTFNEPSSPPPPPVKQTWDEFCREQAVLHGKSFLAGRQIAQNQLSNVPSPQRPPSSVSSESFLTSPQVNSARPYQTNNGTNRWQSRNSFWRSQNQDIDEPLLKTSKKRKKPLSQNVPAKKEWALEDAERALLIERECNKRSKSALIIKFPDLELNRDIVSGFHSAIENVHFQQPSTPRFCFVTLKEGEDVEAVLADLNKYKFGNNYLVAEHKKDRDEDQVVSAKDVDPYTLYVGNLAQEITKEDMVQLYPHSRRIDIGYAKKMKYTRYAFVVFHTIEAAIESFKRTHNHQIYNKSLIVRFRRLHGTVGMPGDSKQQNPPKQPINSEQNANLQLPNEDLVEVGYESNRVTPFTINVKEEYPTGNEYDEEYNVFDELPETNLVHRPKSIKLEVKNEVKPEVYEYALDTKAGIKTELKKEQKFIESELDEYSDVELENDGDFYPHDDEFRDLYRTVVNQREQATNLRSTNL